MPPPSPSQRSSSRLFAVPPRILGHWEHEDALMGIKPQELASLAFPGLTIPIGVSDIPLIFNSSLNLLNTSLITEIVNLFVLGKDGPEDHNVPTLTKRRFIFKKKKHQVLFILDNKNASSLNPQSTLASLVTFRHQFTPLMVSCIITPRLNKH